MKKFWTEELIEKMVSEALKAIKAKMADMGRVMQEENYFMRVYRKNCQGAPIISRSGGNEDFTRSMRVFIEDTMHTAMRQWRYAEEGNQKYVEVASSKSVDGVANASALGSHICLDEDNDYEVVFSIAAYEGAEIVGDVEHALLYALAKIEYAMREAYNAAEDVPVRECNCPFADMLKSLDGLGDISGVGIMMSEGFDIDNLKGILPDRIFELLKQQANSTAEE
jgi:hypothetical protein